MSIEVGPASGYGVAVADAGSNNTKGSWVEILASTAAITDWVIFSIDDISESGSGMSILADFGIGAAGAETAIVANVPCAMGSSGSTRCMPDVHLPITIPASTRIAGRCQTDQNTRLNSIHQSVVLSSGTGSGRDTSAQTYGALTGTSKGTAIDCGGTLNTFGSYAQLVASTSAVLNWLAMVITGRGNTAPSTGSFRVEVATGAASSEVTLSGHVFASNGNQDSWCPVNTHYEVGTVASGTRLSARGLTNATTGATNRVFELVVHGVSANDTPQGQPAIRRLGMMRHKVGQHGLRGVRSF